VKEMSSLEEKEKFTARNDYAFKKLFGTEENKDILIDFLSFATGIDKNDFQGVEIQNNEITPQFYADKAGRLDIKTILKDERKINIEMQNIYFSYYPIRSLFYWAELFTEKLKKGDEYSTLVQCIAINILNAPFPLTNKLHSVYNILEREEHSLLDDAFEIHFFDLTKLTGKEKTELGKWLMFIKTDEKRVREKLAKENPMIAKANDVMNMFYSNEKEREAYRLASKYECDRISMLKETERKSMAQGAYNTKLETARNCLALNMPIETISKITGLMPEEILKL